MIQIKHRSTGNVIKEVDATSLVYANLRGADLKRVNLQDTVLHHVDLQYANLFGADLRDANLQYANLQHVDLQRANLQHADLRYANLQHADLRDVDLQYADLRNADLQGIDIRWVSGDGERIITIITHYKIVVMSEHDVMAIGCEQHTIDEWMSFSDEEIDNMDTKALEWWKDWKPRIQQIIDNAEYKNDSD
jgi:uncharacterized protein YjbI with pentapeptide repeats